MVHGKNGDTEIEIEEVSKVELDSGIQQSASSPTFSAGINGSRAGYGSGTSRDDHDYPTGRFETVDEMSPLLGQPDWGEGKVT